MDHVPDTNIIAGWREWVKLPGFGVPWLKAKLDTGARTSALHAFEQEEFRREDTDWVRFVIHPWQVSAADPVAVELPIHDRRMVRSSSGHAAERLVVLTDIDLMGVRISAEVTLSRRDEMGFRMLIGREALRQRFLVDSGRSYLGGHPPRHTRRRNRAADPR